MLGHVDLDPDRLKPGAARPADDVQVVDPEDALPRIVVGSVTARPVPGVVRPAGDGRGLATRRREVHPDPGGGGAPGDPERHPGGGGHRSPGSRPRTSPGGSPRSPRPTRSAWRCAALNGGTSHQAWGSARPRSVPPARRSPRGKQPPPSFPGPWATDSSASGMAAYDTTPCTTKPSPGQTMPHPTFNNLRSWDIWSQSSASTVTTRGVVSRRPSSGLVATASQASVSRPVRSTRTPTAQPGGTPAASSHVSTTWP